MGLEGSHCELDGHDLPGADDKVHCSGRLYGHGGATIHGGEEARTGALDGTLTVL